jgi:hypothetical protein
MMLKVKGRQSLARQAAHKLPTSRLNSLADRKSVFEDDPAGLPAVDAAMATHRNRIETAES